MAMGNWWPLLLLGGGSTAATVLLVALMQNDNLINNIFGWGSDSSDDTGLPESNVVNTNTNIYDVAAEEARSSGAVSTSTAALIAQEQERAANEAAVQAEIQVRQQEIDKQNADTAARDAANEHMERVTDAAVKGGIGGAIAGGLYGAAVGMTGGPITALVGAAAGSIIGATGLVVFEEVTSGEDWWPFW